MGRKSTRIRYHRRDRRKAKESGWKRGLKRKMNNSASHGETGSNTFNSSDPVESVKPIKNTKFSQITSTSLKKSVWEGQELLSDLLHELKNEDDINCTAALREGVEAYWSGLNQEENPYNTQSSQYYGWKDGWLSANNEVISEISVILSTQKGYLKNRGK